MKKSLKTKEFYDNFWPKNIPDFRKNEAHVFSLLPDNKFFQLALDAGCGTGVCSLAISKRVCNVIGADLSHGSLNTAVSLANHLRINNLQFVQADLLHLPFNDEVFDLVFSWGVIHHTVAPMSAWDELVRVLKKDGVLILAVYLKTRLTFLHEFIIKTCLTFPSFLKRPFIKSVAFMVRIAEKLGKSTNVRADNQSIESQVENWFFVPEKHFFTIDEMKKNFFQRGLTFELLCPQTGRFKSSSNFIVRGVKR
jgi:ubiquinone/menaquinone biosynthesis C-methylase UbiE